MGKKGRRTRWRTLTIADELSDSEESNTTSSGHRVPKAYQQKNSFYGRFTYSSSQSTPIRRHQFDGGPKSTRSSSTASENKITFNEDEYTRITTPRQDVLFKKGYLNKPRTYQTQTSTGTSTASTGNSTENGTPDHQSTDLEYESQFVFPNGFVDQNGIYYVNSYEPYPLMVYNPPTYYQEFSDVKTKRHSTGSLTESTSPNNEEASQSETPSDFNPVYNVIYPGFYYNGACPPQDAEETRRLKKRRRRKVSRSNSTSDDSSDEVFSDDAALKVEEDLSKSDPQKLLLQSLMSKEEQQKADEKDDQDQECPKQTTYDLKPDAEEFVPMAYRQPEVIPMVEYIKIPPNFVPVPILNPMGEFNGAFIPPGIPINFIPPNYVNFVPNYTQEETSEEVKEVVDAQATSEPVEVPNNKNQSDIAKIVDAEVKTINSPTRERNFRKNRYQNAKSSENQAKPAINRNYSETLMKKKPQNVVQPQQQQQKREQHIKHENQKPTSPVKKIEAKSPKNQWISVSSRKKRKNRNVEEDFDGFDEQEDKDLFESYDVDLLQDVVIPPPSNDVKAEEETIVVAENIEIVDDQKPKTTPNKRKSKNKNKTTKSVTKRVIIKDMDLSLEPEAVEEKCDNKVTVAEEIKKEETPAAIEEVQESNKKGGKSKKKKKSKTSLLSESSLNPADDSSSYDFLLESTLLDESQDKTNLEISQELDKMIQRGMYSNLEEKIKSMNMETNENFFKSIINNISSRESSVEKNSYTKTPDFSKILENTTQLLKSKPVPSPPVSFLDDDFPPVTSSVGNSKNETLYPITNAVKEWMTKTREKTPDIEILKSPSTIFREFCAEDQTDEVTVYSFNNDDLDKNDEEEIEVYESSYGKNEDYLLIQREIEEKKAAGNLNLNFPKPGNLPYRAICCSIM